MKKFTILVTVFFISSVVNLNAKSKINSLISDPYTCWDVADDTVSAFQEANLKMRRIATHESEFRVWESAYDACMNG